MTVPKFFDNRYQLSRIRSGAIADYVYMRDEAGNITLSEGFQEPDIPPYTAYSMHTSHVAAIL